MNNASERVINALENGSFKKLILGASNTNKKHAERLSLIATLAGFDVIDIGADKDVYNSAKAGIEKSRQFESVNFPLIMISTKVADDRHFRKAFINSEKCDNCQKCKSFCDFGALFSFKNKISLKEENCYGCGKCSGCEAIEFKPTESTALDFLEPEAIEIHTENASIEDIEVFLKENKTVLEFAEIISFSVSLERFSKKELVSYVENLIEISPTKPIIQIDGKSMIANEERSSSLETIYGAMLLQEANIKAYIQLSGGVNYYTPKLLSDMKMEISGVGWGSYLRKVLHPYINIENDKEFLKNIKTCISITENLVKNLV